MFKFNPSKKNKPRSEFKYYRVESERMLSKRPNLFDKFKQGDLVFGLNSKNMDDIHNALQDRGYSHYYCNSLNNSVVPCIMQGKQPSQNFDRAQKKHYRFLFKYKNYLQKKGGKPVPLMQDEPEEGAAFRRSCKLLLVNRDSDRRYNAHVILDDNLDWTRVLDKSDQGVTNSELRAAYRDSLLHGRHRNILFYNENKELLKKAPWEEHDKRQAFKNYKS